MSKRSTPTPHRAAKRSALAERSLPFKEVKLLVALVLALALGGRGSITASGDVTNTTIFSLATAP